MKITKKIEAEIKQEHGSYPDAKTQQGETVAFEKIKKENAELRDAIKRRTIELENKNRELKIEAALEKVRTIAMGMKQPDDMLDVCKKISLQLQSIGVKEIRNIQTAIFNEQCGTYMNYEYYAKHNKSLITETTYTNNKIHKSFATEMLKGKGKFFITHIKDKEVKEWVAYQKTTNVFIDKYLNTASSLNYYWYSLGPVALGISTYHPLIAFDKNLFKRFLTVFELAYRRYLDIKKAEAQAREAQIEAALERVRGKAMAMHNSDDLAITVDTFFSELTKLNVMPHRCGVGIMDEQSRTVDINATTITHTNKIKKVAGKLKLSGHPVLSNIFKHWKVQKEYHPVLHGNEILEYYSVMNPQIAFPDFAGDEIQYGYYFFFKEGGVFAWTDNELSEEDLQIFRRYTSVLSLTYRRYIDLKEAEAQAREAQIEAALERVRSKTMAMHNSQDVGDTVVTLFDEVLKLGLDKSIRCGIGILEGTELMETWSATSFPNGDVDLKMGLLDMTIHPLLIGLKKAWNSGKNGFTFQLIGNDVTRYYNALNNEPEYPFHIDLDTLPDNIYHNSFFYTEGILFAFTSNPLSDEAAKVLNRFAGVFGQTYRRYLDLKKAEAQTREAQIEAALERVRARSMSMYHSEELAETASLLFQQFKELVGIPDNSRTYISLIDENARTAEVWMTLPNGQIRPGSHQVPLTSNPQIQKVYNAWKDKIPFVVRDLTGTHLTQATSFLSTLPHVKDDKGLQELIASPPKRLVYTDASFAQGLIGVMTNEPLDQDALDILTRFAHVFEQTYTRFLDLKTSEEQNIIIQRENERKTQELEEARELQLAMLPKVLPKHEDLEIAVYMKTATEVGGDYYDFCFSENDSLNICLGDATGHGIKPELWYRDEIYFYNELRPKWVSWNFSSQQTKPLKA